jgi:hypothetical protein
MCPLTKYLLPPQTADSASARGAPHMLGTSALYCHVSVWRRDTSEIWCQATSQKALVFILAPVRTWNLTCICFSLTSDSTLYHMVIYLTKGDSNVKHVPCAFHLSYIPYGVWGRDGCNTSTAVLLVEAIVKNWSGSRARAATWCPRVQMREAAIWAHCRKHWVTQDICMCLSHWVCAYFTTAMPLVFKVVWFHNISLYRRLLYVLPCNTHPNRSGLASQPWDSNDGKQSLHCAPSLGTAGPWWWRQHVPLKRRSIFN